MRPMRMAARLAGVLAGLLLTGTAAGPASCPSWRVTADSPRCGERIGAGSAAACREVLVPYFAVQEVMRIAR